MRFVERKIISWLLLVLLSVYIVPKELFHAFHSHTETRDKHDETGKPQIDSPHSHCYLLQLEAPCYIKEASQTKILVQAKHYCFIRPEYKSKMGTRIICPFLRGPPSQTL